MKVLRVVVMACVALLIASSITIVGSGQKSHLAVIRTGFLTGNDDLDLGHDEKLAYVSGVFDGFTNATLLGAPDSSSQTIVNCLPKLRQGRLEAIVSKYSVDNPDKWGYPMSTLVYNSLPKAYRAK